MFQTVFAYVDAEPMARRGADVLAIRSIEIVNGQITVYAFAGYSP